MGKTIVGIGEEIVRERDRYRGKEREKKREKWKDNKRERERKGRKMLTCRQLHKDQLLEIALKAVNRE